MRQATKKPNGNKIKRPCILLQLYKLIHKKQRKVPYHKHLNNLIKSSTNLLTIKIYIHIIKHS